jgi:uncharacterized membrane protein YidH (DUF202 family)
MNSVLLVLLVAAALFALAAGVAAIVLGIERLGRGGGERPQRAWLYIGIVVLVVGAVVVFFYGR